jgi:hypothetical protein
MSSAQTNETSALGLKIKLWVAIVFMAVAFTGGFLVRGLAQTSTPVSPATTTQLPAGQVQLAPPLTQQQLQEGLPSGHPGINEGSGAGTGSGGGSGSGQSSPAGK